MTDEQRPLHGRLDAATTALLLEAFQARYAQELAAEEDVFRSLPFFATALGVGAVAAGYVANNLPWGLLGSLFTATARTGAAGIAAAVLGVAVAAAAGLAFAAMILLLRATRGVVQARPVDETRSWPGSPSGRDSPQASRAANSTLPNRSAAPCCATSPRSHLATGSGTGCGTGVVRRRRSA